jgi:glycosyltransferase involved in cell wall biosynthesis
MRIVVVEPRRAGGMIHYAYRLCAAMAEAGADVTLITSTDYELAGIPHTFAVEPILRPTSRPAGPASTGGGALPAIARRVRRIGRLASALTLVLTEWVRLARRLLQLHPDVVQFGSIEHAIEAPFLHFLRARGLVLADVVHEPEIRTTRGLRWAVDVRLYRWVYPAFHEIFLHGEANRRRFAELYPGVPSRRLHTIQMGSHIVLAPGAERDVDLRARHGIPAEAPVAVFFGTLLPSKGIEDLLEAFVAVRARRPDARLLIAGHPSRHMEDGSLERLAESLGIADAVTVDPHYVPNEELGALMGLAQVVVFPYRNATQSGALQMAYAYGRPVIVTRAGALPEVVEEGRSGLVIDPRRPDQLAEALLAILDDPEAAERMGAHARHLSETRHSWASIAGSILTVYRGLVRR